MRWKKAGRGQRSKVESAFSVAWSSAPKCLVFVDVADDHAEWIGQQHRVRHFLAEAVDDVRGPAFPALLLLIAERVEDLFKLDMRAIRRLAGVVEHHGLDLDVEVRRAGVKQEALQSLGLTHARECRGLHIVREEIERLREIAL